MAKSKTKQIDRQTRLSESKKETMLAVLIRNRAAFMRVNDVLKPEDFDKNSRHFGLLWRVLTDLFEAAGELPDQQMLLSELQDKIEAAPADYFSENEIEQLDSLIAFAFDKDSFKTPVESEEYANWAVKTVQSFLREIVHDQTADAVADPEVSSDTIIELDSYIDSTSERLRRIASLTSISTKDDDFPDNWTEEEPLHIFSHGIPFIDEPMNGGAAIGEVYGILGPYGSCKTTLAFQLACTTAKKYRVQYKDEAALYTSASGKAPPKKKVIFIASYEARKSEMRTRAISFAAKIHQDSLTNITSLSQLSTDDSLKDYEKRLFAGALNVGKAVYGEQRREKAARKMLKDHVKLLDLTGSDPAAPNAGGGGVKEIATLIELYLADNPDKECGAVIIDYAGALVNRYIISNELDQSQERILLKRLGLEVKSRVCDKFNCWTWVMHQLAADKNQISPGANLHHGNSAESKAFAENMHFAFVIGNKAPNNMVMWRCTKQRRAEAKNKHYILKIDGGLSRVMYAENYMLDSATRQFVPKTDYDNVAHDAAESLEPVVSSSSDIFD